MRETELAWAAGFFDGEGSTFRMRAINAGGQPRCYPVLQISQVEHEPIARFVRAVGVGRVRGPYPNGRGIDPIHKWAAAGARAEAVMAQLWPYLSTPKREQFTRAAEEAKNNCNLSK